MQHRLRQVFEKEEDPSLEIASDGWQGEWEAVKAQLNQPVCFV
jgi:hypothetical protein